MLRPRLLFASLRLCGLILFLAAICSGQRIAIVAPQPTDLTKRLTESITGSLGPDLRAMDPDMAAAAFNSVGTETPFNMTVADARRAAAAMGTVYFVLLKSGVQRRNSFAKGDYYEATAFVYLVSGRTGRLIDFNLASLEAETPEKAAASLLDSARTIADRITEKTMRAKSAELATNPIATIEEVPAENSPDSIGLRTPVPYRRIKPEYTSEADLYGVQATVDVEADIAADGRVLRAEAVRWAGFGLDESGVDAVRSMNWRPAERNGKPLPMRVLLRYNFRKIDKSDVTGN